MNTEVIVDQARCTGHGQCAATAPEMFDLDDAGYCIVLLPRPPAGLVEQARSGAEACPELAIAVSDKE